MNKKQILIAAYAGVALLFATYGTFWGESAYRGFMYNLGLALVWPATVFPAFGKAIGGLLWLAVIVAVLALGKKPSAGS